SFGELHAELAERGRTAERPSAAVQIDHHRMRAGALGDGDVGAQARAQLDVFLKIADRREIAVVNLRQFLPGAALRDNVAGGTPGREWREIVEVVFADHGWKSCPLAQTR